MEDMLKNIIILIINTNIILIFSISVNVPITQLRSERGKDE